MSTNITELLQLSSADVLKKIIDEAQANSSGVIPNLLSNSFLQIINHQKSAFSEIANQINANNTNVIKSLSSTLTSSITSAIQSLGDNSLKQALDFHKSLTSTAFTLATNQAITELTGLSVKSIGSLQHIQKDVFPSISKLLTSGISSFLKDVKLNSIPELSTSAIVNNSLSTNLSELLKPAINSYSEFIRSELSSFSKNTDSNVISQYQELVSNFFKINNKEITIDNDVLDDLIHSDILELSNSPNLQSLPENDLKIINEIGISNTFVGDEFDINKLQLTDNGKNFLFSINEFVLKWEGIFIIIALMIGIPAIVDTSNLSTQINNNTFVIQQNSIKFDYFVCTEKAVIRAAPNKNSPIMLHIFKDTKLAIKDSVKYWCLVEFKHFINDKEIVQSGWIARRNIRKITHYTSSSSLE